MPFVTTKKCYRMPRMVTMQWVHLMLKYGDGHGRD